MRLPHLATLLRPSAVTDGYGDSVDGPLAPVGDPFRAWLQILTSQEVARADGSPVVTSTVLFVRVPAPEIREDDVVEVEGKRYRVGPDPRVAVNPRGRGRFLRCDLVRVTRGG